MNNLKTKILTSILMTFLLLAKNYTAEAQVNDTDLIQFSGVVLDADSLMPIPFTTVMIKNSHRGTIADHFGYFSFVAAKGDTIVFSSVGYGKEYYLIPDTLSTNRYSLIQLMESDTIMLNEFKVYPWPSKEQFKEAFLSLRVPDNDMERANRNLALAQMRAIMENMPMSDGSANFKYAQINRNSQLYYAGQFPSWTILNPVAWAQFIDSWKRGDLKRKNK